MPVEWYTLNTRGVPTVYLPKGTLAYAYARNVKYYAKAGVVDFRMERIPEVEDDTPPAMPLEWKPLDTRGWQYVYLPAGTLAYCRREGIEYHAKVGFVRWREEPIQEDDTDAFDSSRDDDASRDDDDHDDDDGTTEEWGPSMGTTKAKTDVRPTDEKQDLPTMKTMKVAVTSKAKLKDLPMKAMKRAVTSMAKKDLQMKTTKTAVTPKAQMKAMETAVTSKAKTKVKAMKRLTMKTKGTAIRNA